MSFKISLADAPIERTISSGIVGNSIRFLSLAFGCLLFMVSVASAQALSGKSGLEAKIALESSLENRLKKVLTEIIGTQDIIVIVNIELAKEQAKFETTKKQDDFILPGVPIREVVSEKSVQSAVMSALGEDTRTLIRKIKATIIVDRGISADAVNVIKEVASGLLGIEVARGDQLLIQKMSFRKQIFTWSSMFYPPNVFWLFAVIAGVFLAAGVSLFLWGPAKDFSKNFVSAVMAQATAIKESKSESSGMPELPEAREIPAVGASAQEIAAVGGETEKRPFAFINDGNMKSLLYLLRDTPSDVIAVILNYLEPELSTGIISNLPAKKQKEIVVYLSEMKELDPDNVARIEKQIKDKISFVVGGQEKVSTIIESSDDATKAELLGAISERSPAVAENIKKSLVSVDMLADLEAGAVQLIIKQLGGTIFGQILKNMDASKQEKILSALPPGAASRIKQEMELARPLSPARLEIEKKRLVAIIKRLRARGLI